MGYRPILEARLELRLGCHSVPSSDSLSESSYSPSAEGDTGIDVAGVEALAADVLAVDVLAVNDLCTEGALGIGVGITVDPSLPGLPLPSNKSSIHRCSCRCNVLSAAASVLSSGDRSMGGASLSGVSIDPLADTASPGLIFCAACPKLPACSPRTTLSGRAAGGVT